MATPTPTPAPTQASIDNIKSAARKLPIKRKTQPHQHQQQIHSSSDPTPSPLIPLVVTPDPDPSYPHSSSIITTTNGSPSAATAYDDYDVDDEDEDEVDDLDNHPAQQANGSSSSSVAAAAGGFFSSASAGGGGGSDGSLKPPPPFKFHRIWSESDEIRFLQGLLGCYSQGLVFPRDLNLFYDRFSESMPQPYTRSQLSEKLRRLRKKFRIMSSRISRGQDPSRLAPHDRDLLHLCTRLWHPDHASSSPFSSLDPSASSSTSSAPGNKRRRPNPRVPPPPLPPPPIHHASSIPDRVSEDEDDEDDVADTILEPGPVPLVTIDVPPVATTAAPATTISSTDNTGTGKGAVEFLAAKAVVDTFDGALKEVRMELKGDGSEMSRRLQEQRLAELDVFAARLRLVS